MNSSAVTHVFVVGLAVTALSCLAGCGSTKPRRRAKKKKPAPVVSRVAPPETARAVEPVPAIRDASVLRPVGEVAAGGPQRIDVALKPLGLAGKDFVIGGARRKTAALSLNTGLVKRVALQVDDIHEVTLGLSCRRAVPSVDVLASGDGTNGRKLRIADQASLGKIALSADQELVIAIWKRSWHYHGGARATGLAVTRTGPNGSRRVMVPAAFDTKGQARTEIGTFSLVGLNDRDKLPVCELRVPAVADGAIGRVPGARGVGIEVKGTGSVGFHTQGRQNWDAGFRWAPALAFTPNEAGTYAVEGQLAFYSDHRVPNHKFAWIVGRMSKAGASLDGATVAAYRLLKAAPSARPAAGIDYAREPVGRVRIDGSGVEKAVEVALPVGDAVKAWLSGEADDCGILLQAESASGAPPEVAVSRRANGTVSMVKRPKHVLFDHQVKPRPGVYATMKGGRLFYGEDRLRLWGVVSGGMGERNRRLGFNCARLWHSRELYDDASSKRGKTAHYSKGDDSGVDRFDRKMASLKENDVFVMFATLIGNGMKFEKVLEDGSWLHRKHGRGGDWKEFKAAAAKAGDGLCAGHLYCVDDRLFDIRLRHAEAVLNHVNQYTGKRYAEEEIIALYEINNESGQAKKWIEKGFGKWPAYFRRAFQRRWAGWLKKKYGDEQSLEKAWGRLAKGESLAKSTIALAPLMGQTRKYPRARQVDFVTFVFDTIDRRNQQFRDFCRSQAPEGVGVNAAPFSFDTQYQPSVPWIYTNSRGDTSTVSMYFWSNNTALGNPPGLYVLDSHRVDDRLSVIYETQRGRPSPYRTEYPYMLSVMTDWQDFDIVVWHGAWIGTQTDEELLAGTAAPPNTSHFWQAVHLEYDPVMSTAVAMAGRLYLGGHIGVAPDPAVYTVGRDATFSCDAFWGVGGREMSYDTFTRGSRIRFEPDAPGGVLRDGKPRQKMQPITDPVSTGDGVVWDWPRERLIIDTPGAKVYVGKTVSSHRFEDGITISGFDTPFIAFSLISADGKPLAGPGGCERAHVSAVFDAKNTGFDYDYACTGGPVEQAKAVRNGGRAPVVVDEVSYTVSFPFDVEGEFTAYDFAMRTTGKAPVKGNVLRRPKQTEWMGILEFTRRGAASEPVVDASPGVSGAGAGETVRGGETTDARLARVPNPLPDLSWGDSYARAHRVLRDGTMRKSRVSPQDLGKNDRKLITIDEAEFLMATPANVEIVFERDRMKRIHVEFAQAPSFLELVAGLQKAFGSPSRKKLTDNAFEQSEVRWSVKKPGGTLHVFASETQGVVRVAYSVE